MRYASSHSGSRNGLLLIELLVVVVVIACILSLFGTPAACLADPPPVKTPTGPTPTLADVHYGSHERQVLDFYKAPSERPTPLLFHIHGGGWKFGDKKNPVGLAQYLANGISVVSINYRYTTQAQEAGVNPPVEWPMHDAARALQFVRTKASEWNIDKSRIGASGGSAGACTGLWLAFHPDMADPKSNDPVARESTRLFCAAEVAPQTTLDPQQMREWMPNSVYGAHAFGFTTFSEFAENRDKILAWIQEYSPYHQVSRDDPPIYLYYRAPPAMGQNQKDPTHSANFGVKLREKLLIVGVECELVYPGASDVKHDSPTDFLIEKLKALPTTAEVK